MEYQESRITFLFPGVLHQILHQQIFSINFSELTENYLEENFCQKNVFKTPVNPHPFNSKLLVQKNFFIDAP